MNKQFILTTAAILAAGSASAADLGARAAMAPAPAFAQTTWGGLYVGAFAGGTYSRPNVVGGSATETYVNDLHVSDAKLGGLVGGAVGYNWQSGAFVYGLEADLAGVFGSKSCSDSGCDYGSSRTNYVGTVRARAGYAFDKALVYLTAGYAGVGTKDGYNDCTGCRPSRGVSVNNYHNGLALGGGVEYAFDTHFSVKAEALQILTERKTGSASANGYDYRVGSQANQTILKIGLNYRM
jgi:outer membrane immunogenic protein